MAGDEEDRLGFKEALDKFVRIYSFLSQARSNTMENFRLAFDERFMNTVIERMDENEAIFKRIIDNDEFRQVLMDLYAGRVYRRAREGKQGE